MTNLRRITLGIAAFCAAFTVACADTSLPLSPRDAPLLSRGGEGRGHADVQALRRIGASHQSGTDRVLVTPGEGGTLSAGGVTLTVPAGAVGEPVVIQMTVPNGRLLFAKFQPHGLEFQAPATLTFDLSGTNADRGGELQGVYVGQGRGAGSGKFESLETFAVSVSGGAASFGISHFSGYIVASGRASKESF